jgi:arylsulfatase A-like enzyme
MGAESSRREFLRRVGLAGAAVSFAGLGEGCAFFGETPPNIVLVFMDDLGYGDLGVYGAQGYSTPHLDRLAQEGMRFSDFYASQAVCSASRASLLTGCYSERVSILGALGPSSEIGINAEEETLAEILKARGYATGIFGKWHLGHRVEFLPLQHGFDEYLGVPYSNDMWPVEYDGTRLSEGGKSGQPPLPLVRGNETVEFIEDLQDQDRLTTLYAEGSVAFIEKHRNHPFFLYLAHSMPHVPLGVSDKFRGHSEQGLFGDVLEEIDWSVGELLAALDRNGLAENTLVIFTSDNGPWLNFGNHAGSTGGLREGKGTAFEGGPRVPAIMRWPGRIEAGSEFLGMASTIDILPTLAAISGAALPEAPIDGVSLVPVLEGDQTADPREEFLFYYGGELRGIREGKWKRVFEHRTRSYVGVEAGMDGLPGPYAFPTVPAALYDLERDVGETTDVSDAYPEVVARLEALAEEARESLGDRLQGRRGSEVRPPGRRGFNRAEEVTHLAVGAEAALATPPSPLYSGAGASTLTDGFLGTRDHRDGSWLGFSGDDLDLRVDLGRESKLTRVGLDCLSSQGAWIFLPAWVDVQLSADGADWFGAGRVELPPERNPETHVLRIQIEVDPDSGPARYLRVRAGNFGSLPDWHSGSGEAAWLFVDEVVVE